MRAAAARLRPTDAPGWILIGLVAAGLVLRITAELAWWPTTTTLSDSWPYSAYAGANPFDNPQHPGGYSALLAIVGLVTHQVAVPVILQHLLGIAAGLVMFAATRRVAGSGWPALFPAAAVLLNADLIYLEHSIMSEGPFVFLLAVGFYAAVRALDEPEPVWRWPLAAGALLAMSTTLRSAGLFAIPVAALALLLFRPRPWRPRLGAIGVLLGAAAVVLVAFAVTNKLSTDRLEIGPSTGWHLYQRVAPFADCAKFDPPEGTQALCETTPPDERPGGDFYLFDPKSPAVREFGYIGNDDSLVGSWARAAIRAEPGEFADAVWDDFTAFFVPSRHLVIPYSGGGLDPQLDWSAAIPPLTPEETKVETDTQNGMQWFYDDFTVDRDAGLLGQLHDYQRRFRFGPTMLVIATLISLLGLFTGPRRMRIGVLLFGLTGIALLVAPVVGGIYVGRYAVPLGGPMAAAAALAATSVIRLERARRRGELEPAAPAAPGTPRG